MQEKLFPVIHNKENLLKKIEILIKRFQLFELPILIIEQVLEKLGKTINPIRSLLKHVDPIKKSTFSFAEDSGFNTQINYLSNCDGVVLDGIETHICIYQTERALIHRGYHVEVVTDAIASRDLNNHQIAIDRISNNGGFLTTVEMLLFNIQERVNNETFNSLVQLVKL